MELTVHINGQGIFIKLENKGIIDNIHIFPQVSVGATMAYPVLYLSSIPLEMLMDAIHPIPEPAVHWGNNWWSPLIIVTTLSAPSVRLMDVRDPMK